MTDTRMQAGAPTDPDADDEGEGRGAEASAPPDAEEQPRAQVASAPADSTPSIVMDSVCVDFRVQMSASRRRPAMLRKLGRRKVVNAVQSVSGVIHRGEAVGVIGKNGSGKSTLMRAIAGLTPVSGGRVWASSHPTLLGVNAALMPALSGERNIVLGCLALGMTRQEIDERFEEIVEFSGLEDAVYRPMKTYSAGMGSRLRFAIATAKVPDILLIDEALNTGDSEFKDRSEARIRSLRGAAGTVLLVSHSLGTVEKTCTRALWMDAGELIMDGPAAEVTQAYRQHFTTRKVSLAAGKKPAPLPFRVVGLTDDGRPVHEPQKRGK